ncbi:MAG: hypothetical protein COA79_13945 [Planctomycetota bacterium]|nr:MAG: hypothetical protein COA79_13945 [Planctomycetota bacterium]
MSLDYKNEIYIGTVLLEKNRWAQERVPSIIISEWAQRFKDEGFDGIELWQNHALLATEEERGKLKESVSPIKIFNSYAKCEIEFENERRDSVELATLLSANGMKFNFGKNSERHEEYCDTVKKWRSSLPDKFRFLCECHGGSTVEDLLVARETFKQLGRDDYEIIIHGFGGTNESVSALFGLHGERITHIHASISTQTQMSNSDIQKRVELLRELGFAGSFTLEFTECVREDNVNVESLFLNAVRDMNILRKYLM